MTTVHSAFNGWKAQDVKAVLFTKGKWIVSLYFPYMRRVCHTIKFNYFCTQKPTWHSFKCRKGVFLRRWKYSPNASSSSVKVSFHPNSSSSTMQTEFTAIRGTEETDTTMFVKLFPLSPYIVYLSMLYLWLFMSLLNTFKKINHFCSYLVKVPSWNLQHWALCVPILTHFLEVHILWKWTKCVKCTRVQSRYI